MDARVVVITGATGGLGQVVAQVFAAQGDWLALLSTNPEKLAALAARLDLPAERILVHAADLGDPAGVSQALQAVMAKYGRIDVLIHLVGRWVGGTPSITASAEGTQQMLQQHLWTTFHLVQAFVPTMQANHWGRAKQGTAVAMSCQQTWFFSAEPQAGVCPQDVIRTQAAIQYFERGMMIWLKEPGRYFILENQNVAPGDIRRPLDTVADPLDINP